mgnify:CR=1 FL=1
MEMTDDSVQAMLRTMEMTEDSMQAMLHTMEMTDERRPGRCGNCTIS